MPCAPVRVLVADGEGDSVDFVLMRRFKDCVNAVPVGPASTAAAASSDSGSTSAAVDPSLFARIQLTTDISDIVSRELRELFELRATSREACDDFTLTHVDIAEAAIVRRIEEWSATHPLWRMRPRTYEQMKAEEMAGYARQDELKARRKQQSAKDEAWPELPTQPRATAASAATTANKSHATPAASSSSSTSATASASASSSSSVLSSPAPAAAASPPSGKSSSFFDADEQQAEYRFKKKQSEKAAAALAAQQTDEQNAPDIVAPAETAPTPPPAKSARTGQSASSGPDASYYFYQSADGQQLYLHALNFRSLLLSHGNDPASLPTRIRGRVLHRDAYVVDAQVRAKFRFLAHLPLTGNFNTVLVDVTTPGAVSKESLGVMAPEFAAERKARALAAKKQRALNQRTIQSSKAHQESEAAASGVGGNVNGGGSSTWKMDQDPTSFPDLANPLGLAAAAPHPPSASNSPDMRAAIAASIASSPAHWNLVAEKGLATTELWEPLGANAAVAAPQPAPVAGSHWGVASAPLATRMASSHGAADGAGWRRTAPLEADAPPLPPSAINRHGQTTLLSTGSKRSYR